MDIKLNYVEQGTGFPLILLHGNGEDHTYFKHQMLPFSEKYRVIAVETRGHGETPRGEAPFTLEQFAEDLKKFMDEQKIERCNLLGFSDGGNIALIFALKYPERIEKLILNGSNLNPSGVKRRFQTPIELKWAKAKLACRMNPEAVREFEMLNLMVTQPNIDPLSLRSLRMPVLVVAGDNDMIKESHTRAIAAPIPNGKLVFLPGDHFVARRNPQAFNTLVLDFLSGRMAR